MQNRQRIAREDGANFSTQLTCFLVGGAVGALVALLFAPKSGRELRDDIADVTRKGVDRTRETAAQLGTRAGEYYEVTRGRATEFYATATHKAGEVADAAREAASRRGEHVSAAIEAGKRAYEEEKRKTQASGILEQGPTYYEDIKRST